MNWQNMARRLRGLHTASSAAEALGVSRRTAINYIAAMRKLGYVKTSRGRGKVRLYAISDSKTIKKGTELYEFINERSAIKVRPPFRHVIHEKLSAEGAIPRAVETGDFRVILAAMHLFRLVENWQELFKQAKKRGKQRAIGALYDMARRYMRVRRMDRRTRNALLAAKAAEEFIIPNMRSKDFRDIERTWRVRIPFNKGDMERYGRH